MEFLKILPPSLMVLLFCVRGYESSGLGSSNVKLINTLSEKEPSTSGKECFCISKNPQGKNVFIHVSPNGEEESILQELIVGQDLLKIEALLRNLLHFSHLDTGKIESLLPGLVQINEKYTLEELLQPGIQIPSGQQSPVINGGYYVIPGDISIGPQPAPVQPNDYHVVPGIINVGPQPAPVQPNDYHIVPGILNVGPQPAPVQPNDYHVVPGIINVGPQPAPEQPNNYHVVPGNINARPHPKPVAPTDNVNIIIQPDKTPQDYTVINVPKQPGSQYSTIDIDQIEVTVETQPGYDTWSTFDLTNLNISPNLILHPFPGKGYSNQIVLPGQQEVPDSSMTLQILHPKIEQWVGEQLKILEVHSPSIKKYIKRINIRILIDKAFKQNGIKISANGDLIDANGRIIHISKLKLVPTLLRDPEEYNKLIAANKCTNNLPYVEVILITLTDPQRILGIIPLGVAHHPHKKHHGKHHCNLCGQHPCCKGKKCDKKNIFDKLYDMKIKVLDGVHNYIKSKGKGLIRSILKGRRTADVTQHLENKVVSKHGPVDIPQEDDDESAENDLGIRIIGGQPATSSGTPLNNRGRSAYYT